MTDNGKKFIVSLTTYPKRFEYLQRAIKAVIGQTIYDKVDVFYINVDDNIAAADYARYKKLRSIDKKIRIKACPAKWRSCNKLVWVYKDHPDDVIACFDDDKIYPPETLEQLYWMWMRQPGCIISHEVNPVVRDVDGRIKYKNIIDVKLNQIEYGKYLSNGCLFPPRAFTDMLFDYDEMMYITNGLHDELWFWLVSTLNYVPSIGLDYTYSYSLDVGVELERTDSDLSNVNNRENAIEGYNRRINEKYGRRLSEVLDNSPVKFFLNHGNILTFTGNIDGIHELYGNLNVQVICDKKMATSWRVYLVNYIQRYSWRNLQVILPEV